MKVVEVKFAEASEKMFIFLWFVSWQLSSKIDADLFLEDEGSGRGGIDDLEISGSGNGYDDEDFVTQKPQPPKTTPKSSVGPEDIIGGPGVDSRVPSNKDADIDFPAGEGTNNIFNVKEESQASFFSQPGILAGEITKLFYSINFNILLWMLYQVFVCLSALD